MTRLAAGQRAAGITGRRVRILNVLGLRAQESPRRALMTPFSHDERASNQTVRWVDEWLPIHSWTTGQVWARVTAAGTCPHPVYAAGMPRLSCRFCVLASHSALILAPASTPKAPGAAPRWRAPDTDRILSNQADSLVNSGTVRHLPWQVYEVRRVIRSRAGDPTRAANASQSLRALAVGSRAQMTAVLRKMAEAEGVGVDAEDGIERAWLRRRGAVFPAAEHFLVAAPAGPEDKDGPGFEAVWQTATESAVGARPEPATRQLMLPLTWTAAA